MRRQIRVEGPSDRTIVSAILGKFSLRDISIRSGHGPHKGKDRIIDRLKEITLDERYDKFLILLDKNALDRVQELASHSDPPGLDRSVFVLFIPNLEIWVRQLLPPEKRMEYDKQRQNLSKRELATWASRQFRRSYLEVNDEVQTILRFCRCEDLSEYRFPTAYLRR